MATPARPAYLVDTIGHVGVAGGQAHQGEREHAETSGHHHAVTGGLEVGGLRRCSHDMETAQGT